jgi:hypothetical protein
MKRIAYSFLLIALLSCGKSQPSSSTNRIVIQFRDSVIRDFYLLSVRDESLVVAPYTEDNVSIKSLVDSAHVVPFSKIEALYKRSRPDASEVIGSGFVGCLVGGVCGCFTALPYVSFGDHSGDGKKAEQNLLFGFGSGIVTGVVLGLIENTSDKQFFLDTKDHLNDVRERAVYPHYEPYELQKIR